jgi:hypothetical protein
VTVSDKNNLVILVKFFHVYLFYILTRVLIFLISGMNVRGLGAIDSTMSSRVQQSDAIKISGELLTTGAVVKLHK